MRNKIISRVIYTFIILLLLITYGCYNDSNENIYIEEFPIKKRLVGEPVKKIKALAMGDIIILDTLLIIQNHKNEKLFSIYNLTNYKLLFNFGTKGRGPGEFLVPEMNTHIKYQNFKPILQIFDLERRRLTFIDILETLKTKEMVYTEEVLPKIRIYVNRLFYKNDSIFIGAPEAEGRFMIYNYSTKQTKIISYLPEMEFPINKNNLNFIYTSVSCINEKTGVFVSAPLSKNEIDFFDFSGNYLHSSTMEKSEIYKSNFASENITKTDAKRYIISIKNYDNLIYALNEYLPYTTIRKRKKYPNSKIQVFSWKGEAIKEYIMDRHLNAFAVDTLNKNIYGVSIFEEEYPLIKYNYK